MSAFPLLVRFSSGEERAIERPEDIPSGSGFQVLATNYKALDTDEISKLTDELLEVRSRLLKVNPEAELTDHQQEVLNTLRIAIYDLCNAVTYLLCG